ncbi:MAG TPA: MoaD/ThiS family protein [Candidatus Polarisedimenticolaceae bacterium]
MNVRVLYFASLADRAGLRSETIELATPTDIAGLWALVGERHPGLAELPVRPMAACDRVYASWDRSLEGVEEVAFLPPVSGG